MSVKRYFSAATWEEEFHGAIPIVLASDYDALAARLAAIQEVLCNVQHGTVCPAQPGWLDAGPCTCGLDAAIASATLGAS